MAKISPTIEKGLFAARWLLAPLYIGLALSLALVLVRFAINFWDLASTIVTASSHDFTLNLLSILDLVLLGNLILIVVFAGYENFVSKIDAAQESEDRPHWMGTIDFSGLKLKLIGSLVAISVIELLRDFIHLGETPEQAVGQGFMWRVLIHLVFVLSAVMFALADFIAAKIAPHHGSTPQV